MKKDTIESERNLFFFLNKTDFVHWVVLLFLQLLKYVHCRLNFVKILTHNNRVLRLILPSFHRTPTRDTHEGLESLLTEESGTLRTSFEATTITATATVQ